MFRKGPPLFPRLRGAGRVACPGPRGRARRGAGLVMGGGWVTAWAQRAVGSSGSFSMVMLARSDTLSAAAKTGAVQRASRLPYTRTIVRRLGSLSGSHMEAVRHAVKLARRLD